METLYSIGRWFKRRVEVQKQGFTRVLVTPIALAQTTIPAMRSKCKYTRLAGLTVLVATITAPFWVPVVYLRDKLNN